MIDPILYKQVMRRYATGVMVLTVRDGEDFHAVTVNSVTSVSLEPTLLLVCLEKNPRSHELVHAAQSFALNILSGAQMEIGKKFAYDREARNTPGAQASSFITEHGELWFHETLGNLECRVVAEYAGGDHTIFLGNVVDAVIDANAPPLVYIQGEWHTFSG